MVVSRTTSIRKVLYAAFKMLNEPVVIRLALRAAVKVAHIYDTKSQLVIENIETRLETGFRISDVRFVGS